MYGKMSGTLLTALTNEQADMLRREMGPRGLHRLNHPSSKNAVTDTNVQRHLATKTLKIASQVTSRFVTASTGKGRA